MSVPSIVCWVTSGAGSGRSAFFFLPLAVRAWASLISVPSSSTISHRPSAVPVPFTVWTMPGRAVHASP
jgi:hypothetical protein